VCTCRAGLVFPVLGLRAIMKNATVN
jgi:hypothetical protein